MVFDSIETCVAALKRGEIIIVTDDEDRENEGDCICAAKAAHAKAAKKDSPIAYRTFIVIRFQAVFARASL